MGAVLLWINGPFGGGKTATAYELLRRVDQSIVCDPEHLGYGLHRVLPPELRTDFQTLSTCRQGVHEVRDLAACQWGGPVIVLAERGTVLRRLRRRTFGLGLRHEQWAIAKLDECLATLQDEMFAEHLYTDEMSAAQVADAIARSAGVAIRPDSGGVMRARLRLYRTSLAHIRRH